MDNILDCANNYGEEETAYRIEMANLNAEKSRLFMEIQEINTLLENVCFKQIRIRRFTVVGMIVSGILFLLSNMEYFVSFSLYDARGNMLHTISAVVIVISAVLFAVLEIIHHCFLSDSPFWMNCANILRFDNLESKRKIYLSQIKNLQKRCTEIENRTDELQQKINPMLCAD